jgi:DNA polymerase III delta subunit
MSLGISYDRWQSKSYDSLPPVILASGPETQLKKEFVQSLLDSHDGDPEQLSVYADETSPESLLQELQGQGLFNQEKWVVLKHLDHSQSGGGSLLSRYIDVLKEYAEDPEPETTLILFDADHPYRKGRGLGTLAESIQSNGGWSIIFWEPFDDALRETVSEKLSEAGLRYDRSVVQKILERTRGKYSRLVAETEKLIDSVDERVRPSDVEAIVSREEASDAFDSLKRSFVSGDCSQLLRDFKEFWRRNEAPPRVIHVLFDFLDTLRTIRQLTRDGQSLEDALSDQGLPTNQSVKSLYKKGLNWIRKGLPKTFYRKMYEAEKNSKYAGDGMDRLSVEEASLELLSYQGPR